MKTAVDSKALHLCKFCLGTGLATFIDMDKVPNNIVLMQGDETWKEYEEISTCPEGCEIFN